MAIYVDESKIDVDNITSEVFRYLLRKHKSVLSRFQRLDDYYRGDHLIFHNESDDEKVCVNSNYAKYVTDITLGYYLGEPIKYNNDDAKSKQSKNFLNTGVDASVKNGNIRMYDWDSSSAVDIERLVEVYDNQTISDIDAKIGKDIGKYGCAYELEYANSDSIPEPRSAVIDPRNCIMVRDNTVEHNKLFAIIYDIQQDFNDNRYYDVTVYTSTSCRRYRSTDLDTFEFHEVLGSKVEHYFGEVPIVEYQNNDERQGDYEQVIPLIDGLNELLSDRITDKKKFVNSMLAMFGITLDDESIKVLRDEKFLDGLPPDAKIEYIQKVFDESSMQILCNDIIREIHKITMTVNMTDEHFAGNSSGQAMKLKLLTMNMLVKNKMRNLEKGLKKRFEMYNYWLNIKGEMQLIDKKELDIVFTISMPINEQESVNLVKELQGIVDDKTLLSQLWFIKDVDSVLDSVKKQREEQQKQYMKSFGLHQENDDLPDKDNQEQDDK